MATTDVINGRNLVILVDGNIVGHAKNHSIEMSDAGIDTTSKDGAGFETSIAGLKSVSLSGDGLLAIDDTYTLVDLTALWLAGTIISYQYTTSVSGDDYWTGNGRIENLSSSGANEEAATYSFSIKGTAAITNPSRT